MDSNYYIVEFEDGIQLIPNNWFVNGKSEAYWPNYVSLRTFDKAIEAMEEVKAEWKTYKIHNILGKSDSFQRGKDKLKNAEIYSDLSTDSEGRRKTQRQEIARKRISSSSDESEVNDKDILPLPKVPKRTQWETSSPKATCSLMESNCNTPPMTSKEKSLPNDAGETSSAQLILRTMSGLSFKLSTIARNQADIIKRLDSIQEFIAEIGVPKENQMNKDISIVEHFQETDNLLSLFPINDDENMGMVETKLEDHTFKAQFVKEFLKIGGTDIKSTVYNLLPRLFTHSHAELYSWYGAKGKKVFASLNVATAIQEIVRCRFKEATNTEIEIPVKKWLSKAKERLERERKRNGNHLSE